MLQRGLVKHSEQSNIQNGKLADGKTVGGQDGDYNKCNKKTNNVKKGMVPAKEKKRATTARKTDIKVGLFLQL